MSWHRRDSGASQSEMTALQRDVTSTDLLRRRSIKPLEHPLAPHPLHPPIASTRRRPRASPPRMLATYSFNL